MNTPRPLTAEYGSIAQDDFSTRTIIEDGRGVRIATAPRVELATVSAGYECAGSAARWTNGYWSVRFTLGGAFHGKRFTLTAEGEAEARAYFTRLTTAE